MVICSLRPAMAVMGVATPPVGATPPWSMHSLWVWHCAAPQQGHAPGLDHMALLGLVWAGRLLVLLLE